MVYKILKELNFDTNYFSNKKIFFLLFTLINILINLSIIFIDLPNNELNNPITKLNFLEKILIIGLLFPVFEEFIYRYPLKINSKSINIIFLFTLPISLFLIFYSYKFISLIIVSVFLFYFLFSRKLKDFILRSNTKYFKWFFFILSILFTLSHISNYSSDSLGIQLFLVFLTFISSILFSIIRVFIGFKHVVFSHIIYNMFFLFLSLIF